MRSAGQSPSGTKKERARIVTGRRNAVRKPPREKRPQNSGSRTTSCSSRAALTRIASWPGLYRGSNSLTGSSAISEPPEHEVQDRRGRAEEHDNHEAEDSRPVGRTVRRHDGLGLADQ